MDLGIKDRVALVTGAGRGIGLQICQTLAEDGVRIAVNDLLQERAEEGAAAITKADGQAIGVAFDVTDIDAVIAGVQRVIDRFGQIDILVNNAGIPAITSEDAVPSTGGFFSGSDHAQWDRTMGLITYGVLNCSRAVIECMGERRWGASSISSQTQGEWANRASPPIRWPSRRRRVYQGPRQRDGPSLHHGQLCLARNHGDRRDGCLDSCPGGTDHAPVPARKRLNRLGQRRISPTLSPSSPRSARVDHRQVLSVNGGYQWSVDVNTSTNSKLFTFLTLKAL